MEVEIDMKSLRLPWSVAFLLVVGIACAPGAGMLPAAVDAANPWQVIMELNPDHSFTVAGFFNETVAITAAAQGYVRYSPDGGTTWTLGEGLSTKCRAGLDVLDENTAWTVGHDGRVQVTTDGGQRWESVTDVDNERMPAYISFLDTKTGWAASSNQLWATADGGQTWTSLTLPPVEKNVIAMVLRTAKDGYLLDSGGTLHVTADGGKSWTPRSLGLDDEIVATPVVPTVVMRFFDADHGVVILNHEGQRESLVAFRTADGGQSWSEEVLPVEPGVMHLTHDGTLLTVVVGLMGDVYVVRY